MFGKVLNTPMIVLLKDTAKKRLAPEPEQIVYQSSLLGFFLKKNTCISVDAWPKLIVPKTFVRRLGRHTNIACAFDLGHMSTEMINNGSINI